MATTYKQYRGSVVMLKYHLIWIPRRRRRVLVEAVADRLEGLLAEKAEELEVGIECLAIKPDHLHMFVNAPPSIAVSQLVYRFKGYTARVLRQEFPHLRKMPSMWTTAYFASTAGRVSEATIQKYIEAHSKRTQMRLRKVYRFRMRPTKIQEDPLYRMAGARRFVYNWALDRRKGYYAEHGEGISAKRLSGELTALKSAPETHGLEEADSQMLQQALRDVERAYDAFFKKRSRSEVQAGTEGPLW